MLANSLLSVIDAHSRKALFTQISFKGQDLTYVDWIYSFPVLTVSASSLFA